MKDYRVTVKVRNNRILRAIEAIGGTPGGKWCEANGLQYVSVNGLINMTASPVLPSGDFRSTAARLCEVLGKLPEELWSTEQLYPLEKNFSDMEIDGAQLAAMLPQEQQYYLPDFSNLEKEQAKALMDKAKSTLSAREQRVLQMRFEEDNSYEACGKEFGVTKARVQQIERTALNKLRHPTRVGVFVDLLDEDNASRAEYKAKTAKYLATLRWQS